MADALPPLLEALSEADQRDLMGHAQFTEAEFGALLAEEDGSDPYAAVVLEGGLAVEVHGRDVCALGPDDVVGPLATIGIPRGGVTVRVVDLATLMILHSDDIAGLRENAHPVVPELERRALATLARVLLGIDDALARELPPHEPAYAEEKVPLRTRLARLLGLGRSSPVPALDLLRDRDPFGVLPPDELEPLAERFTAHDLTAGSVVQAQGEEPDRVGLLVTGRLDVLVRTGEDRVELLGTVEPGELFGLASLAAGRAHSASLVASRPSTVLTLPVADWRSLVADGGPQGAALRRGALLALGRALGRAHDLLADVWTREREAARREVSRLGGRVTVRP